jgi:hypothetical protein
MRLLLLSLIVFLMVGIGVPAHAQSLASGRKQGHASRVPSGSIQIDGLLDDKAWELTKPMTDFVQKEPVEGAAPSDNLEVRFAYDDSALYVAARMSSGAPIQAPMGRRDNVDQAEYLMVSLDTYLDRTTAYTFGVSASGVRLDQYHPSDTEDNSVKEFDPVWQARTRIVEGSGWTAELWIPLSQLRFNDRSPQIWGLNVRRWIPSRNEEVYWVLIPRTDRGWASRFGDLDGIEGLRPAKRVELVPYVSGNSTLIGSPNKANPFEESLSGTGRAGMDAKIGFGSNLTLDVTVNPDFGQVEADPAEVNLSAFETFFSEQRPFFLEGSRLLTGSQNNYFYSRRVGANPSIPTSGDYLDYPNTATILGAGKLTGRLPSKTSIGMLAAVTRAETARSFTTASQALDTFRVAPLTSYALARVQQEFGPSFVGVTATAVHRNFESGDPLAGFLTRNAFTISTDSVVRFGDGEWELPLYAGFSTVAGEAAAIDRLQRSSVHYLQRPDMTYGGYDPTRTSMRGAKYGANLERRNGRHWVGNVMVRIESPGFEPNDMGRIGSADGSTVGGRLEYRETVPGRWLRGYSFSVSDEHEWNFGGDQQVGLITPQVNLTWRNFWETNVTGTINTRVDDERLTRGGPLMQKPRSWRVQAEVESSDASQTRGSVEVQYGRTEDDGMTFTGETTISVQPGPRWLLSLNPVYEHLLDTQQYVSTVNGGGAQTYGRRYVFAHIDRHTYSTKIRLNYTFKPDLNVDLYAEPFAASGSYSDFGELEAARSRSVLVYGTDGTTITTRDDGSHLVTGSGPSFTIRNVDFNTLSFRSNLVLRWEWRPGSTFYVVWQQDRSSREAIGSRATAGDLFDSFSAPGRNFLAVKASFWFSVR